MKPLHPRVSVLLAASILGLLFFSSSASAQFVSREQIIQALTTQPISLNFADKLRLRSLTLTNRDFVLASAQSKPTIDLHEIYFKFNFAAITAAGAAVPTPSTTRFHLIFSALDAFIAPKPQKAVASRIAQL